VKPAFALGLVALCTACRVSDLQEPESFDPAEVAGVYAIQEVDGHPVGWYHDLAAVSCQVAFIDGELDIGASGEFTLDLDYNFRCLGAESGDGSARFYAHGNAVWKEGDLVFLRGLGPNFVNPLQLWDNWTFELKPDDAYVTLRFTGSHRAYFGDPVITLGPRQ